MFFKQHYIAYIHTLITMSNSNKTNVTLNSTSRSQSPEESANK